MRKILFVCFLSLSSFAVFGQKNIVKVGVTNLFSSTLNLEYEYVLNEKSSIQAEIFTKIPRKVPGQVTNLFTGNATDNDITISSSSFNYFGFLASYRYYTGTAAKRFYLSPFIKYGAFNVDMAATFNDVGGSNFDVPATANGTFAMTSVGVDLGYQWIVNDRIAINWAFLGLGFANIRANATYESELSSEFDQWKMDIEDFFDTLPGNIRESLPIQVDLANNQMSASGSVPTFILRSSISVGYVIN